VPLVFVPLQSPEAVPFPTLSELHRGEIVVIDDAGAVLAGRRPWVMCLVGAAGIREWSQRLAHPALLSLARRLCEVVAANRYKISHWLRKAKNHEELQRKLALFPTQTQCAPGVSAGPAEMKVIIPAALGRSARFLARALHGEGHEVVVSASTAVRRGDACHGRRKVRRVGGGAGRADVVINLPAQRELSLPCASAT